MTLTLADRVTPAPDVIVRVLGDEAVVVHLQGGLYFGLDEVGTRIWTLCEEHDLAAVADRLTHEFEVDRATAEADVLAFAAELARHGLIVPVGHG